MENPKIRFKGFAKDWEQRKLRECAEFNPKSELPDVFEYIDLESVVGTNILSHRTESKSSAPSRAQRLAQKGDVFYQTVRPYQKNNCIFEKNDNNWVFSTGYAQLRPVNDSYFLLTLLQNEDFVKLVLDRCTGTSYPAINSNDLADIDVNVPSDSKEQQQIGTYFKQLDHLITLHQRKCEQTKKLKKYMLQKMFPQNGAKVPEIRFDGFTYDWEQRKLGELGTVQTCKRIFKDQTSEKGDIPFFKNGTIGLKPDSYISREMYEEFRRLYPYPEVGDTLISVVGSIGRTAEYTGKDEYFQDSNVVWLKTDGSINKKFLKISYQVIKWLIEGSTVKHLYNDNILRSEIVMPVSQIEQAKIAEFFEELDHLITLHQRKCDELKKMKKYMLQNMFI